MLSLMLVKQRYKSPILTICSPSPYHPKQVHRPSESLHCPPVGGDVASSENHCIKWNENYFYQIYNLYKYETYMDF